MSPGRGARRPPSGGALAVLLPGVLAVLMWSPVVGTTPVLTVLLPTLLVASVLAVLSLREAGRVVALVMVVGAALAAALLGGLLAPPGVGRALAVAAGLTASVAGLSEILLCGRRPAAAALPPVVLAALALPAGAATAPGLVLLAAALAVASALVLLVTGPWNGESFGAAASASPTRAGLVLAAVATVLCGVGALGVTASVAPSLGDPLRVVAVTDVTDPAPPPGTIKDVTPLARATRWQTIDRDDDRVLVSLRRPARAARVVWVTVDHYTGDAWLPPVYYTQAGPRFPDDPVTASSPAVEHVLDLQVGPGLPGPWVPTQTRVVQVTGAPVHADRDSGSVISYVSPIGIPFEVRSREVRVSTKALVAAGPAATRPFATELALPGPLPPELRRLVDRAAAVSTSPYRRLVALAQELRAARMQALDVRTLGDVPIGRSLADLDAVLTQGAGLQEQYAAAFALGARDWNVPTRLALGWLPTQVGPRVELRAADTSVWAQAELAGIGWVSFQPTPQDRDAGRPAVVAPPRPVAAHASPSPTAAATATATARPDGTGSDATSVSASVWGIPLAALLLVGGWLVGVRVHRRRRRAALEKAGDPRSRTVGAWDWSRLQLAEAGLALPPGVSPDVVSDRAGPDDLTDDLPPGVAVALREVAALVAPCLYAPEAVAPGTSEAAWRAADGLAAALGEAGGTAGRLRRLLRPVPPAPGADPAPVGSADFSPAGGR